MLLPTPYSLLRIVYRCDCEQPLNILSIYWRSQMSNPAQREGRLLRLNKKLGHELRRFQKIKHQEVSAQSGNHYCYGHPDLHPYVSDKAVLCTKSL
jgi:hypothetical protein